MDPAEAARGGSYHDSRSLAQEVGFVAAYADLCRGCWSVSYDNLHALHSLAKDDQREAL